MALTTTVLLFIIGLPILLFGLEFFLCKRGSAVALILPVAVACFFVILGYYAIIMACIMFAIYFVMKYLEKEKRSKLSEIEKMNIEDL